MIYIQRIRKSCIDKNAIWQNQRKLQTFNEIKWTNFKRGRNIHNNTRHYDPLLWHQNNQIVCVCTQSCLTVCNPMNCGSPGFSVHVISQARIVNGLPFPSPGDLPNPGIKSGSPALQADSSLSEPPGRNHYELEVIQVELYLSGFHRGNIFPSTRAPGSISLVLTAFFQGLHFFP